MELPTVPVFMEEPAEGKKISFNFRLKICMVV